MKFSIVSPVHVKALPFVERAYQSLCKQDYDNWEWILAPNGGAEVPKQIAEDKRVCVHPLADDDEEGFNRVGRIKHEACSFAAGDILVEFDPDDILTPDCLPELALAFQDEKVMFAYSNSAEFRWPTWESEAYSRYWGWEWRPFHWQEGSETHTLKEMIAWPISPHSLRRIEWAPNHVRAFRRTAYEEIGGHNAELKFGDDHELSIRFYLAYGEKAFAHIDRCLYLYRVHGENSCRVFNNLVQQQSWANYVNYTSLMAEMWAREKNLLLLDFGGAFNCPEGYQSVDIRSAADVVTDLENNWPFDDDSVGVARMQDFVEHLRDPIHLMNELYRVLAPGGWAFIRVPSTEGRGAFQDPTHVSFWNENSFAYYTQAALAKYLRPQYKGRFQEARPTFTYFPNNYCKEHEMPYVCADLIALKAPYDRRPPGEVLI